MTQDPQPRWRNRKRLWLALAILSVLLIGLVLPPLISISRYKSRITQLVSASLGRPVRLSSVELRLLPRPGFVLTDLTVQEDPAFGAEPVLHANTVTAAIRLLSLWRGRLEISSISVDEASLNLVRTEAGRWNLDPLFHNAAAQVHSQRQGKGLALPYLEATNSRINIKRGLEKLPYSLVNADLSFWQESPGAWRVRLRGQPARTDVSLDPADTGIVQLEATLGRAPELHKMPVHIDMEWRDAQLGQLSRLVIGSDPGWRGDLRGELHLDGTAESANVKARLRATGVHRVEFAPTAPLDFDANCSFVYRYSAQAIDQMDCDSPLGDGHIRLAGSLPGNGSPGLSVQLQRIPVQAGLDMLRTLRNGIGEGLQAGGTVNGELTYSPQTPPDQKPVTPGSSRRSTGSQSAKPHAASRPQLAGSLTVDGFELSGDALKQPIQIAKTLLEPAAAEAGESPALTAAVTIPAGGAQPLALSVRLGLRGYQVAVHGPAALDRIREFARVAGVRKVAALDNLAGDPAILDLDADGPWLPGQEAPFSPADAAVLKTNAESAPNISFGRTDQLTGTITLRNANWKFDTLASHVELSQATLHLNQDGLLWDPAIFSYGPVKGIASLHIPPPCDAPQLCLPQLQIQFADLDAGALQAALLGAHKPGTMLSSLLARFSSSSAPLWPALEGTLKASTLTLGPIRLQDADAELHISPTGAELTRFDARLLGGKIQATGNLENGDKPAYSVEGNFAKLSAPAVCQLVGLRCVGGLFSGKAKVNLAGFSGSDLAASARGHLHFDWRRGQVLMSSTSQVPSALARFDLWSADSEIANGALTLQQNTVQLNGHKSTVDAAIPLNESLKVSFPAPSAPKPDRVTKR